jgi:hypothetical protein
MLGGAVTTAIADAPRGGLPLARGVLALRLVLVALLAMPLLLAGPARAQAPAPRPAPVSATREKVMFLLKVGRYVTLPEAARPAPGKPFYLCVIGRARAFGPELEVAAGGRSVDGHPIAVRRFATAEPAAVAGCHLAFVAGLDDTLTTAALALLARWPVLTLSDAERGTAAGIIHLLPMTGRVRFRVDLAAAQARGLTISSRLLALAAEVQEGPR